MFGLINIYSKSKNEVSRKLSNLYHNEFVFDGQTFPSFESFLQCLKFSDPDEQLAVASMCPREAKEKGQTRDWQMSGFLYWKGQAINRYGREYQQLLDRAYDALCENADFAEALRKSTGKLLIHTIGKNRRKDSVLTQVEFCSILMKKRRRLIKENRLNANKASR